MAIQRAQDPLSAEQLQLFTAGLAGLAPDEIRKAKLLYLKNALSEFKAMTASLKAFGAVQIIFAVIPVFWPILWLQRTSMKAGKQLFEERITNALEVWEEDLGDEAAGIRRQLATLSAGSGL